MVSPSGFSVAQVRTADCPGWMELGLAVKLTMRAGGANRARLTGGGAGGDVGTWAGKMGANSIDNANARTKRHVTLVIVAFSTSTARATMT